MKTHHNYLYVTGQLGLAGAKKDQDVNIVELGDMFLC